MNAGLATGLIGGAFIAAAAAFAAWRWLNDRAIRFFRDEADAFERGFYEHSDFDGDA